MRVFATRSIPEMGLLVLRQTAQVDVWAGPENATRIKEQIIQGVRDADLLLSLLTETAEREVLAANLNLMGAANYAVGSNNIMD